MSLLEKVFSREKCCIFGNSGKGKFGCRLKTYEFLYEGC